MSQWSKLQCRYCNVPTLLCWPREKDYPWKGSYGPVYICLKCKAFVGTHPGTCNPLGEVANAELRELRKKAHASFDFLWQRKILLQKVSRHKARTAGYRWLAAQLGIPFEKMHISQISVEQVKRVIEVCEPYLRRIHERYARSAGQSVESDFGPQRGTSDALQSIHEGRSPELDFAPPEAQPAVPEGQVFGDAPTET